ncbi:MAG TPA: glutaredoxin domain-containing protein [Pyrinomonadaceae bacterium]|jgi:glutaredoxin|nr:glutaredoxin domain-containing protein [Pyrinomonadaceae bacterium]
MSKVIVYGADWCGDTRRTLQQLERLGVVHEYVDVERDEGASAWVKEQNDGKERKPTVKIGERVLSVPDERELEATLHAENLISKRK